MRPGLGQLERCDPRTRRLPCVRRHRPEDLRVVVAGRGTLNVSFVDIQVGRIDPSNGNAIELGPLRRFANPCPPPPTPTPAPPPPPPTRIDARVDHNWTAFRRWTRNEQLAVSDIPEGAAVELRCRGKGCPPKRRTVAVQGGKADAHRVLRGRHLRVGDVLELRITRADMIGAMVGADDPRPSPRCSAGLAPDRRDDAHALLTACPSGPRLPGAELTLSGQPDSRGPGVRRGRPVRGSVSAVRRPRKWRHERDGDRHRRAPLPPERRPSRLGAGRGLRGGVGVSRSCSPRRSRPFRRAADLPCRPAGPLLVGRQRPGARANLTQ